MRHQPARNRHRANRAGSANDRDAAKAKDRGTAKGILATQGGSTQNPASVAQEGHQEEENPTSRRLSFSGDFFGRGGAGHICCMSDSPAPSPARRNLVGLSRTEIAEEMAASGAEKFRAGQ